MPVRFLALIALLPACSVGVAQVPGTHETVLHAALAQDCPIGCRVELPPGDYTITAPLVVTSPKMAVKAHGVKVTAVDTTAVRFERSAYMATWEGGHLVGVVTSTMVRPLPVGMDIRATVFIRDFHVQAFVRGVQLACASDNQARRDQGFEAEDGVNCNGFALGPGTVSSNWLDGVYVTGSDANTGLVQAVNSFINCKRAFEFIGAPEPAGDAKCANFHENSFLGNTYVGVHSAHSIDTLSSERPDGIKYRYHQYLAESSNGRTVWLGAYSENDSRNEEGFSVGNGRSIVRGFGHMVLGGLNQIETAGDAYRVSERGRTTRSEYVSEIGDGRKSKLCFGCDTLSAVSLTTTFPEPTGKQGVLRLIPQADGWLELEAERATADRVLELKMTRDDEDGQRGDIRLFKAVH